MSLPKQLDNQPKRRSKIIESKPSGAEAKTSTPSLDLDDSLFLAVLNAEQSSICCGRPEDQVLRPDSDIENGLRPDQSNNVHLIRRPRMTR